MIQKFLGNLAIATLIPTVIGLGVQPAFTQPQNLTIIFANRTGTTLTSLQTAPAQSRSWQANILLTELVSGAETEVKVANSRQDCRRDIKAVFSDGSTLEDYDVDLCKNDIYTFTVTALW